VTSEIVAALIGAGIALVGGIAGAFLQHFLSLRKDRIKRERDAREEKVRELREQRKQSDKYDRDREEREIDRLREVLLESVSSRLAAQDLEEFLEEVERKHDEDGLRWAERSREALRAWLTERLQEAVEEPNSQGEGPVEISD
jgi:DNA-binding transcriptional regulator GbsR (MarR family)